MVISQFIKKYIFKLGIVKHVQTFTLDEQPQVLAFASFLIVLQYLIFVDFCSGKTRLGVKRIHIHYLESILCMHSF